MIRWLICLLLAATPAIADEYDEAVKLIRDGKFAVAETLLQGLRQKGDAPRYRYANGYCAEKQGRQAEAVRHYQQAILLHLHIVADVESANQCWQRLAALRPDLNAVLNRANELRERSRKAKGADQAYLEVASDILFAHALDTPDLKLEIGRFAGSGQKSPTIEGNLGYRLLPHPPEATQYAGNGHYYLRLGPVSGWEAAQAKCREMGGYLATIASKEEEDFISSQIGYQYTWVGIKTVKGQWQWITGEPLRYTNWSASQPSVNTKSSEAYAFRSYNGRWYDLSVGYSTSNTYGFVCEWEY